MHVVTAGRRLPRLVAAGLPLAAFVLLIAATAAPAAQLDVSAGYDSDPAGTSGQSRGDYWAGVTARHAFVRETNGPLTLALDLAAGATGYARLDELGQLFADVRPAADWILSPQVDLEAALGAEAHLVRDDEQSAWAWRGSLRLRERLGGNLTLAQYASYRDLRAREEVYSATTAALGAVLRADVGSRWSLGAACEYAHGDFLSAEAAAAASDASSTTASGTGAGYGSRSGSASGYGQGPGAGAGSMAGSGGGTRQHLSQGYEQVVVRDEEDRVSGSLAADYTWSRRVSSGVEYVLTRVLRDDGDGTLHAVTVRTTFAF